MLLSKVGDVSFLKQAYPELRSMLMSTGGDEAISCFVCWVEDAEILERRWSKIASLIAIEFQAKLSSKFSSWNIYLAFVCQSAVERPLRYSIENDRFSMRKIVLDKSICSEDEVISLMNNDILCHDLEIIYDLQNTKNEDANNKGNSSFRKFVHNLGDIPITQSEASAKIRAQKVQELIRWNQNEN